MTQSDRIVASFEPEIFHPPVKMLAKTREINRPGRFLYIPFRTWSDFSQFISFL